MAGNLPVISVFGVKNIRLESMAPAPDHETRELDCRCYLTDENLQEVLANDQPVAIASFGNADEFKNLQSAPFDVSKKWLHFDDTSDLATKGHAVFSCFLHNAVEESKGVPLVTVFTPAYKTGDRICRPFHSLLAQTHSNWEWVIMDDSNDDGVTFKMLTDMANKDSRIKVYKSSKHTGNIGKLKKECCLLARGEFLIELDHDDELTPNALADVVKGFQLHPECGFVYTDFAELFEDASEFRYPPGWGFGYGSYREETHNHLKYQVVNAPNINAKTIRHIIAAPNHIRAWRKSTYLEIGGHSESIHVADDYELMVRTFLNTRMCRVPTFCYLQYRNFSEGNTHQARNKDIQRLVRYFSHHYDDKIHARLVELGVDDYVWEEGKNSFERLLHVPRPFVESHCTVLAW